MFTDGNNEKSRTGLPVAVVLELRQASSNEGDDGNDCDDRPCYAIESIRSTPHRLPLFGPHQTIFTMFKCSTVAAVVIVEKASYGCVALHPHIHRMDTMQFFPTSVRRYKHKINKTLTTMYE